MAIYMGAGPSVMYASHASRPWRNLYRRTLSHTPPLRSTQNPEPAGVCFGSNPDGNSTSALSPLSPQYRTSSTNSRDLRHASIRSWLLVYEFTP